MGELTKQAPKNKSQSNKDRSGTVKQEPDDGQVTADWILKNGHRMALLRTRRGRLNEVPLHS